MPKMKLIFGFLVLYASLTRTHAADTISANQVVRYNQTIISPKETFELGFFNPGNSTNHYVGIWYKKISNRTVVWVANRNTPLRDNSSELTLTHQGILILRNATTGNVTWSSANSSTRSVRNPIGQLQDTGNFIIYEEGGVNNQEDPIWQSFDFMTDTLLPGMKHGKNLVTGIERHLTSWKSADDPASGEFSDWIDTRGYPQLIIRQAGEIMFRGGPWNGLWFTGTPNLKQNDFYHFTFVLNESEIYFQYNLIDTSALMRLVLQPSGRSEGLLWINRTQTWSLYTAPQIDRCDQYAVCGPSGICNINNSPFCLCLKGFEPRSPDQWRNTDWSQGCRRTIPLDCDPAEGFKKYTNLKLPDTQGSWYNQTMTLEECKEMCKRNCSCTAYTNSNISGTGSGCLLWFGDLIDIRTLSEDGDTLYIRMSASELESIENSRSSSAGRRVWVIVPVAFVVLVIIVSICLFYRFNRKKQQQQGTPGNESGPDPENRNGDEGLELPLFGLSTILKATNNFSINAKLGEGGFGPVYKISDFGMARTFGGNQIEANTNRVVGT
ncbi:hypothetical protein L1987_19588 [Smallanthus sonchifolius]|uniref:Uncharacterized protein n=1 Tax=Smallanthus sonchifolius TaxID=185202 RepID=A0ACB9IQQ7_9ASTR|nr:hypothetical protein L1987_19588 [Smallanthus sonchifolius]